MPRKPRVEYAGAVYHVMSRGNHAQKVFRTEGDCATFLETLGEACGRTGWKVHAYVLMGNHYHLLLETPEANLVAGMQWLQSTYTKRFNAGHREWGHLFRGRYKAIPVETGSGYFPAVATYIHLNPVRMKGYDFARERLADFRWSSYPAYVGKRTRPGWLCVERVMDGFGMADTVAGRRQYAEYMAGRIEEVRQSDQPWKADGDWRKIRRGWHFGGEGFRRETLERVAGALRTGKRTSFGGEEIREHGEACAESWIAKGMERLGLSDVDLARLKKNSPEKYALAWLARRNTAARPAWIKERLKMGTATGFADFLGKLERSRRGKWGYEAWRKVKGLGQKADRDENYKL
jgi:putative transposase